MILSWLHKLFCCLYCSWHCFLLCCLHQAISSPFQMHYLNLLVLMVHQNSVIFGVLQYRLQNQCLLALLFILQLIIGIVGLMFRYIQKMELGYASNYFISFIKSGIGKIRDDESTAVVCINENDSARDCACSDYSSGCSTDYIYLSIFPTLFCWWYYVRCREGIT